MNKVRIDTGRIHWQVLRKYKLPKLIKKIILNKKTMNLGKMFSSIIMEETLAYNYHPIHLMNQKLCKVEIIIRLGI